MLLMTAGITYAFWVLTEPFLQPVGAAKYLLVPVYFILAFFTALPITVSALVFTALLLAQFSGFKQKNSRAPGPRAIEYYEYSDEARDFVKRTGYF